MSRTQPNIVIVTVGHPDYPTEVGQRAALEMAERLTKQKVHVEVARDASCDHRAALRWGRWAVEKNADGVILLVATWIEAPVAMAAIREFEHIPFAVWSFVKGPYPDMPELTGSFVGHAVLKGALDRLGYPCEHIVGRPDEKECIEAALAFARAAFAKQRLKRTRLGLVGYASMGMYSGTMDHVLTRGLLGPEIVHIDTHTLIEKMKGIGEEQYACVVEELRNIARVAEDVTPDQLQTAAAMALALRELAGEYDLDGLTVKCQYELSQDFGMTACVALSLLADWGTVASCEGDLPCLVTQQVMHWLTGNVTWYGDLLDVTPDGVYLSPCGFCPFSLAADPGQRAIRQLGHPGFEGLISSAVVRPGPVTIGRIVEERGGFRLVYALGEGQPSELRMGRFPALSVALPDGTERLLEALGTQHFAVVHGHLGEELRILCKLLNISEHRL